MERKRIKCLVLNLKLSERCNLNCSYCYYFADAYPEVYERPPLLKPGVAEHAIRFFEQATEDFEIDELIVAFHGGEPTLLKATPFRTLCESIQTRLEGRVGLLTFTVQTNGVHLTDEWLQVLLDFRVHVGVSLDGPRKYNDRYRLDHRGQGSYDRIRANIARLVALRETGELRGLSLIAVLNAEFDYGEVYDHFVNDLDVKLLNFLLPDHCVDSQTSLQPEFDAYADAFCEMFDRWLLSGQHEIRLLQFSQWLSRIGANANGEHAPQRAAEYVNIVVHSDGEITLNDSYMAASAWYRTQSSFNVSDARFSDYMQQPIMEDIAAAETMLPDDCAGCRFSRICRGGDIEHRFSADRQFNNRSAYCQTLLKVYAHIEAALVEGGYPHEHLRRAFGPATSDERQPHAC